MYDLGEDASTSEFDRINELRESSKETMMNMIYNAVINEEDRAISSETPKDQKLEALNNIIDFFVQLEEYEKCSNIKKIIDRIQC